MKIGSFLPIQSNPGKPPGQSFVADRSPDSATDTNSPSPQTPRSITPYTEFIAAAESTTSSASALFNLDRDLPFNSQYALSAYVTNESYQAFSSGELVGVDLYV